MPTLPGIDAFAKWGEEIASDNTAERSRATDEAEQKNGWFTRENISLAFEGIRRYLNPDSLESWTKDFSPAKTDRTVGIVGAGNVPMVAFHDMLSALVAGNKAQLKLSSQDDVLLPYLVSKLAKVDAKLAEKVEFVEHLNKPDLVIATGSNNSSRYFEYYFRDIPHIIRKNRTSVAVLTGSESEEEMQLLGKDVFQYFGLGCRNVSKVLIPEGFDIDLLYKAFFSFKDVIDHKKYANNYDYNRSILLLNGAKFFDNGFLLIQENEALVSPIAVLNYATYGHASEIEDYLLSQIENIQCVVSKEDKVPTARVSFGDTQKPELWDYADNVNTLEFLSS